MWSSTFAADNKHHPLLTPYLFDTTPLYKKKEEKAAAATTTARAANISSCSDSSTSTCEDHHSSGYDSSTSSSSTSSSSSLFSLKVFIGGLPKGATKVQVLLNFQKYGVAEVEMQGYLGFCFLIFKNQACCQSFIRACIVGENDRFFFPFTLDPLSNRRNMVEVKPFKLVDARYGGNMEDAALDAFHPIFVGGLPRDTKAETLAMKLESKFGHVAEVQIDLHADTYYPRGTAMVVFKQKSAARQAISSQTMVMKKGKQFCLIELKPFLEIDKSCSMCKGVGPSVYCASCLLTMCSNCFDAKHGVDSSHKKISRGTFYTIRRC